MTTYRTYRIAIATERAYMPPNMWFDDALLKRVLIDMGHEAVIIDWQDQSFDPQGFDGIFVSSTWNELEDPEAFLRWLMHCEADKERLMNPRSVLEFGLRKDRIVRFLEEKAQDNTELADCLVPTHIVTAGDDDPSEVATGVLSRLLEQSWSEAGLVIKPVISADGFMTRVYAPVNHAISIMKTEHLIPSRYEAVKHLADILRLPRLQGALVQQYVTGIETHGEYSLAFVGERLCNAVKKSAGFRRSVGSVDRRWIANSDLPLTVLHTATCLRDVVCGHFANLTRFRLDLFMQDSQAKLGEIELVSPNLNWCVLARDQSFEDCQKAVEILAERIVNRIAQLTA